MLWNFTSLPYTTNKGFFFTQRTKVFFYTTDKGVFYTTDKGVFLHDGQMIFFTRRTKVFLHDGQRFFYTTDKGVFFYMKDKGDGDASTNVHIQHYNHIVFYLHSLQVQMAAQITSRTVQPRIPIDQP